MHHVLDEVVAETPVLGTEFEMETDRYRMWESNGELTFFGMRLSCEQASDCTTLADLYADPSWNTVVTLEMRHDNPGSIPTIIGVVVP